MKTLLVVVVSATIAWVLVPRMTVRPSIPSPAELEETLRSCDAVLLDGIVVLCDVVEPSSTRWPELGNVSWRTELASDGKSWVVVKKDPLYVVTIPPEKLTNGPRPVVERLEGGEARFVRAHEKSWLYTEQVMRSKDVTCVQDYDTGGKLLNQTVIEFSTKYQWPRLSIAETLTGPPYYEILLATGRGFTLYVERITAVVSIEGSTNLLASVDGMGGQKYEFVVDVDGYLVREMREIVGDQRIVRVTTDSSRSTEGCQVAERASFFTPKDQVHPRVEVKVNDCKDVVDSPLLADLVEHLGGEITGPCTFIDHTKGGSAVTIER